MREALSSNKVLTGLLVVVLALAVTLRLVDLVGLPPALHVDEAASAMNGLEVVSGDRPFFGFGFTHHPNSAFALTGLVLKVFGVTVWHLRVTEVVFGVAAVLLVFLLGRAMFGTRAGLVAAVLMAFNHFALAFSRLGLVNQQSMTVELLAFWLLWEGANRRRRVLAFLGGAAVGLGLYLYFASWVVPVILALVAVWAFVFRRARFFEHLREIRWAAVGFALFALPWLAFPFVSAHDFESRPSQVFLFTNLSAFEGYWHTDSVWRVVWLQFLHTVGIFTTGNDTSNQYGYNAPLVSLPMRAFFFIGLGAFLWRIRRTRYAFLLLWLATTLLIGGALTDYPPFMPRLVGIIPPAMLVSAAGFVWVGEGFVRILRAASVQSRERRWFPSVRTGGAFVAVAALVLFGFSGWWNWHGYFVEYPKAPRTIWWPWIDPVSQVGRFIAAQPAGTHIYLVHASDGYSEVAVASPAIRFYTYGKDLKLTQVECNEDSCLLPMASTISGPTVVILPATSENQLPHLEENIPGGTVERFTGHHALDGNIGPQFLAYMVDMPSSDTV